MTEFTPAQLEAWAGLGPWEWAPNSDGEFECPRRVSDGQWIVTSRLNHSLSALSESHRDALTAAPDLARLVLEKEKEIAEWKENTIAFLGPWAVDYAKQIGLPDGHIHHVHYDLLEKAGARLNAFTRHPPSHEGNQ